MYAYLTNLIGLAQALEGWNAQNRSKHFAYRLAVARRAYDLIVAELLDTEDDFACLEILQDWREINHHLERLEPLLAKSMIE